MSTHLLIIDGQQDFCDGPCEGSLAVPGAYNDMSRLAQWISRQHMNIDAIHASMDCHRIMDIAHPAWWVNDKGNSPTPFTIITAKDVEDGLWNTRQMQSAERSLSYVQTLEHQGNYPLCIWPPHCLMGSSGQSLHPDVFNAISHWENAHSQQVNFVTKGTNPWTEHFSAIKAEVLDQSDPETLVNSKFIETLRAADTLIIAGEALSHCVKSTVQDLCDILGTDAVKKFVFLTDASSSVPGFENSGEEFLNKMAKLGMTLTSTREFSAKPQ